MKLVVPTLEDCEQVRLWRNENLEALRTPYELTDLMQVDFYQDVVCNRSSPHRYWSIMDELPIRSELHFIGFGGLTFIEWENRLAKISLVIKPKIRGKGFGEQAVDLILDKAFNYLNLQTVCGECYDCNPAIDFWRKMITKFKGGGVILPNRKYWSGKFWKSIYFSFDRDDYVK